MITAAGEPVTVMWIGEDVTGLSAAQRRSWWSGLTLDFHACPLDDACIARVVQRGVQAVIVLASEEQLDQLRHLREAAAEIAVIVVPRGASPSAKQALLAGAHEYATLSELDRLSAFVERGLARVQAEQRLTEHRDRLRALFNTMSSGVIVTNPEGRVVEVNEPAIRYLELDDAGLVVDQPIDQLLPGLSQILRDTPTGLQQQAEIKLAGGKHKTVGFSSTASPTGRYRFTLFRDLTPMVEAERQRRRAEQLAQVGEMAARLSHEIKNPLASVLAGLELLFDDDSLSVPQRSIVRDMTREARALSRTIQELLSCARNSNIAAKCMPVVDLVEDAVRACRTFAEREGVVLAFDASVDQGVVCVVDGLWFRRALVNLVINGIEATGRGGKVVVAVRVLDGEEKRELADNFPRDVAVIHVRDDGPGVACDEAKRAFDPFFTTKEGGTGLGLSVATDVIEALGGVLSLTSMPGRGCIFSVYLPSGALAPCWECRDCPSEECSQCVVRTRGTGYACWSAHTLAGRAGPTFRRKDCSQCSVFRIANLRYHRSSPVVLCTEE